MGEARVVNVESTNEDGYLIYTAFADSEDQMRDVN